MTSSVVLVFRPDATAGRRWTVEWTPESDEAKAALVAALDAAEPLHESGWSYGEGGYVEHPTDRHHPDIADELMHHLDLNGWKLVRK